MTLSPGVARFSVVAGLVGCLALVYGRLHSAKPTGGTVPRSPAAMGTTASSIVSESRARELMRRQPGFFVPNLGQWDHAAKFLHRSGSMTVFLGDRGWTLDMMERSVERSVEPSTRPNRAQRRGGDTKRKTRGVAVKMTFGGGSKASEVIGEGELGGYHDYFLGDDETRWRTGVPLYTSVRQRGMYPGIDIRMRLHDGHLEYDLLCEADADLTELSVAVEGANGLTIDTDGSLVIATALGPIRQPKPSTWECLSGGDRRSVDCEYVLLGGDRFGFVVTVTGNTVSSDFPMSRGAYDTTYAGSGEPDAFVSRLDPNKIGAAQLVYSTYLGGAGVEYLTAASVSASGVVTVTGWTNSGNFPTSKGAYRWWSSGGYWDVFVSQLDPRKAGAAQLLFSTYLGGGSIDQSFAVAVDSSGMVTLTGRTNSTKFPTTLGAFATTNSGTMDVFVSRFDPSKTGKAQLAYSTYLGGGLGDWGLAIGLDSTGVIYVAGSTDSSNFPVTKGAFDSIHDGPNT